jgi:hypothetical protein
MEFGCLRTDIDLICCNINNTTVLRYLKYLLTIQMSTNYNKKYNFSSKLLTIAMVVGADTEYTLANTPVLYKVCRCQINYMC